MGKSPPDSQAGSSLPHNICVSTTERESLLCFLWFLPLVRFRRLSSGDHVVAMAIMRVMKVSTHHIVHVVAVRRAFVSAVRSMSLFGSVSIALMVWRAFVGVGTAYRERVFIDVVLVHVMQVTIMEIIGMSFMSDSHVPATGSMGMIVG